MVQSLKLPESLFENLLAYRISCHDGKENQDGSVAHGGGIELYEELNNHFAKRDIQRNTADKLAIKLISTPIVQYVVIPLIDVVCGICIFEPFVFLIFLIL